MKVAIWVTLATALAACGARQHDMRPPAGAAQTPADVDRLFGERLNAGDVEGVVALYEPSATLVRQDRTAATGHDAIRKEIAGVVGGRPHITMHVIETLTGGGDVAVLYNDFHVTGFDEKGTPVAISGRASEVVRRQPDGSWRFVIDDPYSRDPQR